MNHARHARRLVLPVLVLLAAAPGRAQAEPGRHGFWAGAQLGYGSLEVSSDQEPFRQQGVFAMSFRLGFTPRRGLRLGAELNGWLLEAFDPNDPAIGESVSQALVIAQIYPWPTRGWFLKAGAGRAMYTNHHPLAFDSDGWGTTVGAGFDWSVGGRISLTPLLSCSQGSLGDVANQLTTIENRRYHVFDIGVALTWR